jgi:hypothetical protein
VRIRICVTLLAIWLVTVCDGAKASAPVATAPVDAVSAADTKPDCRVAEKKPAKKTRKTGWGKDPFQHPFEGAASASGRASNGARLVAIVGGRKGSVAIFGHSILQKGDLVGNETILDIAENRVTVTHDGCKRIIAMQEAR